MTKPDKPLRLVAFEASNFKRLVAVHIKPDGNIIEITGKNGHGKTSTLDAIAAVLEGKGAIQSQPIRKGQTEAEINIDLGELKVRRTFKVAKDGPGYTTALHVSAEDGRKFTSPQAVLNTLLGDISFDPAGFLRLKPADQFEQLKKFVPDFDFAKMDGLNLRDYDLRTDANRAAKQYRAQAEGIIVPAGADKAEPVNVTELEAKLASAAETNSAIEQERLRRERTQNEINQTLAEAKRHRDRAEELRVQAKSCDASAEQFEATAQKMTKALVEMPALAEPVQITEVRTKLDAARTASAGQAALLRRNELIADAEIKEAEAATLTEQIEARDKAKRDAIAGAGMPVPGLGFGDGIVLFNDVPFDQASSAEQLRVSTAIAMKLNPKLRLILIKDGSLLDEDSMKLLAKIAEENDFQVFIERVDASGKVGVVIEDGRVKDAVTAEAAE